MTKLSIDEIITIIQTSELLAECHEQYAEHLINPTDITKENLKCNLKVLKDFEEFYFKTHIKFKNFIDYVEKHKDFRKLL
jgi:hypothetical protein